LAATRLLIFRASCWTTNVLLAAAVLLVLYIGGWEYSVRRYLDGFYFAASAAAAILLLFMRVLLARYADQKLRIPRFHFRIQVFRAGGALFSAAEIKQ
jgi:NADH:ubiquinone oxidoreductase subunit H